MYRIPNSLSRWRLAAFVLVVVLIAPPSNLRADEKEEEKVEQFLARLGLTDLQILHLERQFDRSAGKSRLELGKQLADLYAQRLMEAGDDRDVYDDIYTRVNRLVREVPEANTPALQVMLLQADYKLAEMRILEWINDRKKSGALAEARKILEQIAPQLDRHWRELAEKADELDDETNELVGKPEKDEELELKEQELNRLRAVLARASFFAGWSNFYFGVTKQNRAAGKENFEKGRDGFRQLLGLTKQDEYDEMEADWLGLESIERSQAVIGLGLCEMGLDNLEAAEICFNLLDHINVPPKIRDEAGFRYVSGLLATGHLAKAVEFAAQQVGKFSGGATQGKVSFCVALIRAEYADPNGSTPETRKLASLGIDGLARLRQIGILRQLMDTYKIEIEEGSGFYMAWVKGQQQFEQAEKTKKKSDYETAAKTLESALKQPVAQKDLAAAAHCRFTLAWCRYRLGGAEQAANHFLDAMPALKESGDTSKAVEAAWTAFAIYYGLAGKQTRFVPQALDAGELLRREFPDSDKAERVGYYLAKLKKAAGTPEERIKALLAVGKNDPNYNNAQYEICNLRYEIWSAVREVKAKAEAAASGVCDAVDRYLAVAKDGSDNRRKLNSGLLAVKVSLRSSPQEAKKAEFYLEKVQPFAEALPDSNSSAAEYHFLRFQLARSVNDTAAQKSEAGWLFENAQGTDYERAAIITLAKLADKAVENATPTDRAKRRDEAIEVYGRLVEILGDSPQAIRSGKNARVANSTLAQYQADAGQFSAAAKTLAKLLAAYPKDRDYLLRRGLATFHARMYQESLGHWRVLLAGLSKGSSGWYGAKYYQIKCLLETDKGAAKKVYRNFKLLYPTIKDEQWREKFDALDRQVGD